MWSMCKTSFINLKGEQWQLNYVAMHLLAYNIDEESITHSRTT